MTSADPPSSPTATRTAPASAQAPASATVVVGASPGPPADRPSLSLPPLIALSLGYFLVMLDVTVVNMAVPSIQNALDAGPPELQWIIDGYSAFFAGLLLAGGGLGDRFGHRTLFLSGLGVFAAASVVCALAPSAGVLIGARLAQGAGAALLVPASFALLQAAYPERAQRARAVGYWGLVSAVAFGAGPAVGGLLVAGFGWRAVFWVNLPVAAVAVLLTLRHVPAPGRMRRPGRADPAGLLLGVLGLLGVIGALNEAGDAGWTSAGVLTMLVGGAACLGAFVVVELRLERNASTRPEGRQPLLPMSLFRETRLVVTEIIGLLLSFGYYGQLFVATLYLQQERELSPLHAGFALLPSVCMGFLAAPLSSRLTARGGPYKPMAGALLLGSIGFLGWLAAEPHTPYPVLLFALMTTGLATPLTVVAATVAVMEASPADKAGTASAVFNMSRQMGSAMGVALFGTLVGTTDGMIAGLHMSAVIAAVAFLTASLLAVVTGRRADVLPGPHA
ncbi:MFS transporter [Streptomyces hydrogenans]|uniref:MFS transporter n=1 Tax=Streptomyces hydrogenans TaxID=1873719 RepID=UPI00331FB58C